MKRLIEVGVVAVGCLAVATPAHAQLDAKGILSDISHAGVWFLVAAVAFAIAYKIIDMITPGDLKEQLAEGNTALAIFVGSMMIAVAIIIAALVG